MSVDPERQVDKLYQDVNLYIFDGTPLPRDNFLHFGRDPVKLMAELSYGQNDGILALAHDPEVVERYDRLV